MLKLKLRGYQHIKHSALHFDFFLCSRPTKVISLTLQKLIKKPPKPNPLPGQAEATSYGLRSLDKQLSFLVRAPWKRLCLILNSPNKADTISQRCNMEIDSPEADGRYTGICKIGPRPSGLMKLKE